MPSRRSQNSPNWAFLRSKSGLLSMLEGALIVVAMVCLGNLSTRIILRPDIDHVFTFLTISALHLGYLSFFVIVNLIEGVFTNVHIDNYQKYGLFTYMIEFANHTICLSLFRKLKYNYGISSDIYISYFLRFFIRLILWIPRNRSNGGRGLHSD